MQTARPLTTVIRKRHIWQLRVTLVMSEVEPSYPLPENETDRLRNLQRYELLDTPEEHAFDNLTELVTEVLDVPIALVCLMDECRQWFKSQTGLPFRETERECSFCNYLLLNEDIMVIEDALKDDRTKNNRLVVDEPNLRSYAGVPLTSQDGHILGTFCILDRKPRSFSDNEITILRRFAVEAINQIELRYRTEDQRLLNNKLSDELEQLENQLQKTKLEKNEILHRIKNNFHQVMSLLKRQRSSMDTEEAMDALVLAETRIHCFLSIYELLARTTESDTINIGTYLHEILNNLQEIFEGEIDGIDYQIHFDDQEIPSDVALKLGIALNELVTNAFQHVFIPGLGTKLQGEFTTEDGYYNLTISDDGPGLPEDSLSGISVSNGLQMIRSMVEHGESGEFTYKKQNGSTFQIKIPR